MLSYPREEMLDEERRNKLRAHFSKRVTGRSLPRELYADPFALNIELEAIFRPGWMFVAHTCEVPEIGDFVTVEIPSGSLLIVRADKDEILAFANVCRHRGFRICEAAKGRSTKIVCPYHQWTYSLRGDVLRAPQMGDHFDPSEFALKRMRCEVVCGLAFVSLAENPWPFEEVRQAFEPLLRPHALEQTRIAHSISYDVATNWKLVVENQRECYHCVGSHPEYVRAQYDSDIDNPMMQAEISARIEESKTRWSALGIDVSCVNISSTYTGSWFRANRTPFRPGFVTESLSGQPVAPRLGMLAEADVGTARAGLYTNFWLHATSDHAVTVRYTPIEPMLTRMTATWLVEANAVAQCDYDLEELTAFTAIQLAQDKELLDRQGRGIRSIGYSPGPYSAIKEQNVERFVRWYTDVIARYLEPNVANGNHLEKGTP